MFAQRVNALLRVLCYRVKHLKRTPKKYYKGQELRFHTRLENICSNTMCANHEDDDSGMIVHVAGLPSAQLTKKPKSLEATSTGEARMELCSEVAHVHSIWHNTAACVVPRGPLWLLRAPTANSRSR